MGSLSYIHEYICFDIYIYILGLQIYRSVFMEPPQLVFMFSPFWVSWCECMTFWQQQFSNPRKITTVPISCVHSKMESYRIQVERKHETKKHQQENNIFMTSSYYREISAHEIRTVRILNFFPQLAQGRERVFSRFLGIERHQRWSKRFCAVFMGVRDSVFPTFFK